MEVTQSRIYNGSFGPTWMTPCTKQMSIYYIFPAGIHSPAWLNIRNLKAAKFRISDQNKHLAAVQSTSFWLWFFSILQPHPHCSYPFLFLGDSQVIIPSFSPFTFFFTEAWPLTGIDSLCSGLPSSTLASSIRKETIQQDFLPPILLAVIGK